MRNKSFTNIAAIIYKLAAIIATAAKNQLFLNFNIKWDYALQPS